MTDWRRHGLCNLDNADLFDRRDYQLTPQNMVALRLCAACPVRQECADDILSVPDSRRMGVIAGGMVFDQVGSPSMPNVAHNAERRREQWREAKRRERQQVAA